ncbi:hypothetical protein ASG90_18040 [Nocardioides sp. Soil797]|nr:hypothetical protein ASG90_18040 [Nocardioides sp. Soil797]
MGPPSVGPGSEFTLPGYATSGDHAIDHNGSNRARSRRFAPLWSFLWSLEARSRAVCAMSQRSAVSRRQ